ncbi:PHD-finger domain-containing protein [Pleurostoma richardsiae]|uniref:PHD-finger domain-containing protein n=1 Tax=Pleurostoma richardsiae TaxID=41990 RepID=A0AA38RY35_9PEZI|nr:PHD-finger domain-containing protein [Pleurostoma richardsiae]
MADPRRSSRARTTQSQSQHSSSTTSSTSGRADRSTRSFNKTGSPQKSTPSASLSSEPPDDLITVNNDALSNRRRTRAQDDEHDRVHARLEEPFDMPNESDEVEDDNESVRCVCKKQEYPGPPTIEEDTKLEDLAGFYVQCDICKVWQHGGCVGIMSEESSPEEYFCEQCKPEFHKIYTARDPSGNKQTYSHFLPLARQSRTTSRAASLGKDGARSPKGKETRSGRQSSLTQTSKRRSTMNSRDAAYDEEEQLRRAIEASKEDAAPEPGENGTRRTKRGRSDSEEKQEGTKRQRTGSRSVSPSGDGVAVESQDESDDALNTRNGSKKSRTAPSRNQKDKNEREERERQRAEAASKRKGRAERRRAEDSDPSEELPLAARATAKTAGTTTMVTATAPTTTATTAATAAPEPDPASEIPPSSQPTPDTPPASSAPQASSKPKRSHQKKGKGRNQYTKDRDIRDDASPARSQSRDVQNHDNGTSHGKSSDHPKSHGRSKGGFNSKVSMTELKRRATAMFDFISKTQLELAGEATPPNQESRRPSEHGTPDGGPQIAVEDASGDKPADGADADTTANQANAPKDFKELSCVEMMDSLTRDLVKWQKEYTN